MFWPILIGVFAVLAIFDVFGLLFWYTCSWPRSRILGPVLDHGPSGRKQIALTFDDGPLLPYTQKILDILKSRQVQATFFLCGKDVEQHPEIVHRMHSDGHTIGNHTWSHPYLYFKSRKRIMEEIDRTQRVIRLATGQTPILFRPPYGGRWLGLYPLLKERGMHLVQWSVSSDDWKMERDAVVRKVQSKLHPGAIVLLHDGRQEPEGYLLQAHQGRDAEPSGNKQLQGGLPQHEGSLSGTVSALPAIIDAAQAMEYEFVSVEDFVAVPSKPKKRKTSKE